MLCLRVDVGVTESPTKTAKKEKKKNWAKYFFSNVGVRILDPVSVGNFHFFGRGKTNFLRGGYNFKTG